MGRWQPVKILSLRRAATSSYGKYCSRLFSSLQMKLFLIKPERDLGSQPQPYSRNLHRFWSPGESRYQLNYWISSILITNPTICRAKITKDLDALHFNNIFNIKFLSFLGILRASKFIQIVRMKKEELLYCLWWNHNIREHSSYKLWYKYF